MSYTDQTKVENFLQRALSADEVAALTMVIPAIQLWIDRKTGSTFDKVDVFTIRKYDGGGTSVDIDPCTQISAVSLLGNEGNIENAYVLDTDYTIEPANETVKRELVKRHGCFIHGQQRIAVTAKFSEWDGKVPMDIQTVATRLASSIMKAAKNDSISSGLKSESLEGHSVTYITSADEISTLAEGDPLIKSILSQRSEILVG